MKKWLDRALTLLVLLAMLAGLGRALLRPKEVNTYENRTANQPPAFSAAAFGSGEYQDALEAALTDQVPLAQRLEKGYQQVTNAFLRACLQRLVEAHPDRYFGYHNLMLFGGDYIVYPTNYIDQRQEALDRKIAALNALFAKYPQTAFYVYYIEKDTDVNFESGYLSGLSDYLLDRLALPEAQKSAFRVTSFDEYKTWFYRTDHHWNWEGSLRGYREVMALLGNDNLLTPTGPEFIAGGMCGSKAHVSGGESIFTEDFYAYRYPFPEMEITIDGKPVDDYGEQSRVYAADDYGKVFYSGFYGGDDGEIIFRTHNAGAGNLLVIGESYDNAILKALASGFENTYSIDLRNYEREMGTPFDFADYLAAHEIDKVLLIGNIDYFVMDEFLVEGAA